MPSILRYTTGSIAIVILFYLGLALVGLGDDICLGDSEAPARALRLDGPERAEIPAGAPGGAAVETEERLILSRPGVEAFQIATDDGALPCAGSLVPGASCVFRLRSVFRG